jgi:hypothetical protein
MKNFTYVILTLLAAFFIISGCSKIANPANNGKIVASKTELKINEHDSLVFVGATSTDTTSWSVTPTGFNYVTGKKNAALIAFTKAGSYTVTATHNGLLPASIVIKVGTDSVSNPSDTTTFVPLTGDQITLQAGYYKSAKSDSAGITFSARTKNNYCSNGILRFNASVDANNNYAINLLNIQEPKICRGTTDHPIASNGVILTRGSLQNGTYPIKATLNGIDYTGHIIVTTSTITFDWSYTSGVLITPKIINR